MFVCSSVRPFVRPLYSSLRLFYTGLFFLRASYSSLRDLFLFLYWPFFFVHPIIHFGIGGFFLLQLLYSSLHLLSYIGFFLPKILFYWGLFSFVHPIIHFGNGGFFLPESLYSSLQLLSHISFFFLPRSFSIGDFFLYPDPIIHFVLEVFFYFISILHFINFFLFYTSYYSF